MDPPYKRGVVWIYSHHQPSNLLVFLYIIASRSLFHFNMDPTWSSIFEIFIDLVNEQSLQRPETCTGVRSSILVS
jgi:hypothetical protein